jgi:hypothetical protein
MRSSLYGGLMFVAILSVGLVLAACGSSSNNSTSTTAALTKAEFLKQGNAICAKGNKATNKLGNQIFPSKNAKPTQAQKTQFENALITNIQGQINGVKALGAPAGDSAKVDAIVNSAQAALDKIKKDPSILFTSKTDPFAAANKLTTAYGLTACGGGGGGGNGGGGGSSNG